MAIEEEEDEAEEGAPAWMATFADLSTLLLTFFVLLFTFAELDAKKFELAAGSLRKAIGAASSSSSMLEFSNTTLMPELFEEPATSLPQTPEEQALYEQAMEYLQHEEERANIKEEVAEVISGVLDGLEFEDDIEVESTSRGVVVKVKDQLFFDTGGSTLISKGSSVLDAIGDIAADYPAGVAIEGHTDDLPIGGDRFKSNWELSAARAAAALEYLTDERKVDPNKLQIRGYAHTRPIAPNDSPEGRAQNRRVEFVFLVE
ncbi:MAG: flagellar motor protein MotB [Candidatus Eisenbacteria bacterium]